MILRRRKTARLACCLLFGIATLVVRPASALDSAQEARTKYETLKAKVQSGDLSIDWQALRLDAVVAGVDGTFDWRKANQDGMQAFKTGNYNEALANGLEIVNHNIANGDGHFLLMVSYHHLKKQQEADQQSLIVDKILQSILDSGNGQTPSTAWFTVSPAEESFLLRILGMTAKSQAQVNQAGHSFNKVTVAARDNAETVFWFNTDTIVEMTRRAFSNPQAGK
jgi:hypothetical protein